MRFTKMHGLGNDYVYVDGTAEVVSDPAGLSRAISDRHTGIGADGLIIIHPSNIADVRMEMYNADGSRGRMCGNGIRCVAKLAVERNLARGPTVRVETDAGVKACECRIENNRVRSVRVDMGRPSLRTSDIPATIAAERIIDYPFEINGQTIKATCVSMGNPHAVVFVEHLHRVDLVDLGPRFEHLPCFPERINVHFVRVDHKSHLTMRTWERGSGVTRACGTGACASGVAGAVTGRTDRRIVAELPGGELTIDWAEDDHVYMTGPAEEVFVGEWRPG